MASILDDGDPQFQPPNIYVEGTWLYGAIVTAILYGVVLVLYAMCARSLWRRIRSREGQQRKNWFFFFYVNFVFALSTLYAASNSQITQLGFINHRDYPGGPSAYETNTSSIALNVTFVVLNWCVDVLMVWRCIVVYRDSRFHFFVTAFGCLMLLASVATGCLWVIVVSQPERSESGWTSFSFLFPCLSVSLAINVVICILTVLRLLYHRACISKVLGPGHGMLYASFAAMIVESAAVYSICSLLYLIPYALDSPLANAFTQILGESQVIAPLLIIYRVSEGKAWTRDMASHLQSSGSPATQQLSSHHHTPNAPRPAKLISVQVSLKCTQDSERKVSIDEDKHLAV